MQTKKYNYTTKLGRKSDNTEYFIVFLNIPKKLAIKIKKNSEENNLSKSKYVSQILNDALEVSHE